MNDMLKCRFLALWLLILVLPGVSAGATLPKDSKSSRIDKVLSTYNEYELFHGAVLVAETNEIIFEKGYGTANREHNIPHEPETKFRIASITKTFAAFLILQLVEAGKIDLNCNIINYLPYYRKDTGEQVTVHHLLNHSSGIPDYLRIPGFWQNQLLLEYSRKDFVNRFCSDDLEYEPGSQYKYSNSGYYLLGMIIEEVTGQSFEVVLEENILMPLGMKNTGLDNDRRILKNRAKGYAMVGYGFVNVPYFNIDNGFSTGQMYSTVRDMYLWDQALYSDKLLSKEYRDKLFVPYHQNKDGKYSIGYSWQTGKYPLSLRDDGVLYNRHFGGLNGFNTLICRLVEDRHLIVLFGNLDRAPLEEMSIQIANILYDQPFELPKKSIAMELKQHIEDNNIDAAIARYRSLRETSVQKYEFGVRELNRLGYHVMGKGRLEDAIKIFLLNVEVYPEYANGWDSLAEAYMKNDNNELAIKYYKKSLELNPENQNAERMLKKLMQM